MTAPHSRETLVTCWVCISKPPGHLCSTWRSKFIQENPTCSKFESFWRSSHGLLHRCLHFQNPSCSGLFKIEQPVKVMVNGWEAFPFLFHVVSKNPDFPQDLRNVGPPGTEWYLFNEWLNQSQTHQHTETPPRGKRCLSFLSNLLQVCTLPNVVGPDSTQSFLS